MAWEIDSKFNEKYYIDYSYEKHAYCRFSRKTGKILQVYEGITTQIERSLATPKSQPTPELSNEYTDNYELVPLYSKEKRIAYNLDKKAYCIISNRTGRILKVIRNKSELVTIKQQIGGEQKFRPLIYSTYAHFSSVPSVERDIKIPKVSNTFITNQELQDNPFLKVYKSSVQKPLPSSRADPHISNEYSVLVAAQAGTRGKKIHQALEDRLSKGEYDPTDLDFFEQQAIEDTARHLESKFNPNQWIFIPEMFLHDKHYASQADLVVLNKDTFEIHILDIKTGRPKPVAEALQLSKYKQLLEGMGAKSVVGLHIVRPGKGLFRDIEEVKPVNKVDLDRVFKKRLPWIDREKALQKAAEKELKKAQKEYRKSGVYSLAYKSFSKWTGNPDDYVGTPVVSVDAETGHAMSEIISVSAVKVWLNKKTGKFDLVDVKEWWFEPKETKSESFRIAQTVHGIVPGQPTKIRKALKAKYPEEWGDATKQEFADFSKGSVILGHNIYEFDMPKLFGSEWKEVSGNQFIDTFVMAVNAKERFDEDALKGFLRWFSGKNQTRKGMAKDLDTMFQKATGKSMEAAGLSHHLSLADVIASVKILEYGLSGKLGLDIKNALWYTLNTKGVSFDVLESYANSMVRSGVPNRPGSLKQYVNLTLERINSLFKRVGEVPKQMADVQLDTTIKEQLDKITEVFSDLASLTSNFKAAGSALTFSTNRALDYSREMSKYQQRDSALSYARILAYESEEQKDAFLDEFKVDKADRQQLITQARVYAVAEERKKAKKLLLYMRDKGYISKERYKEYLADDFSDLKTPEEVSDLYLNLRSAYSNFRDNDSKKTANASIERKERERMLSFLRRATTEGWLTKEQYGSLRKATTDIEDIELAYHEMKKKEAAEKGSSDYSEKQQLKRLKSSLFSYVVKGQITPEEFNSKTANSTVESLVAELKKLKDAAAGASTKLMAMTAASQFLQGVGNVPRQDYASIYQEQQNQFYGILNSAQGVVPAPLLRIAKRWGDAGFNYITHAKVADYERRIALIDTYKPMVEGALSAGAQAADYFAPGVGTLVNSGIHAVYGSLRAAQGTKIINERYNAKVFGQKVQERLNILGTFTDMLRGGIDLIRAPFNLLRTALSTTGRLFRSLNGGIAKFMSLLNGLGTPLKNLTGINYYAYQGTQSIDRMVGLNPGTSNNAVENLAYAAQALYTTGEVDTNRLVAASMLGEFHNVYANDGSSYEEHYASLVNNLYARLKTAPSSEKKRLLTLAAKVDSSLPQTLQVMSDMGVANYNALKDPNNFRVHYYSLGDSDRLRMRKANYQYQSHLESFRNYGRQFATSVWDRGGNDAFNKIEDLLFKNWSTWADYLATALNSFVDWVKSDKFTNFTKDIKASVTSFWDKIKDFKPGQLIEYLVGSLEKLATNLIYNVTKLHFNPKTMGFEYTPEDMRKVWVEDTTYVASKAERFGDFVLGLASGKPGIGAFGHLEGNQVYSSRNSKLKLLANTGANWNEDAASLESLVKAIDEGKYILNLSELGLTEEQAHNKEVLKGLLSPVYQSVTGSVAMADIAGRENIAAMVKLLEDIKGMLPDEISVRIDNTLKDVSGKTVGTAYSETKARLEEKMKANAYVPLQAGG